MLVNFLVNSGCKMFSAKIFLLAGWLGLYSSFVFSTKDINSLELTTDSKGNSDIKSREKKIC